MLFFIPTMTEFFRRYEKQLKLSTCGSDFAPEKGVYILDVRRAEPTLTAHLEGERGELFLIFGKEEINTFRRLTKQERKKCLQGAAFIKMAAIIVTEQSDVPQELVDLCRERAAMLLRTQLTAAELLPQLKELLTRDFSYHLSCHGTLVEVCGMGVMMEGESAVGKSEAALGLIAKGHRLIADDQVIISRRRSKELVGTGVELGRYLLVIEGIGIIDVARLYGAQSIRHEVAIDMVICLEKGKKGSFDGGIDLEENFKELLGRQIPYYRLPIKIGRDSALLVETIALNHRLKSTGYDATKEFDVKLLREIAKRERKSKACKLSSKLM